MKIKCIIKEFPPKSVISLIVLPLAEKMVQDMAYYPLWCVMLVLHWCLGLGLDLSFVSEGTVNLSKCLGNTCKDTFPF